MRREFLFHALSIRLLLYIRLILGCSIDRLFATSIAGCLLDLDVISIYKIIKSTFNKTENTLFALCQITRCFCLKDHEYIFSNMLLKNHISLEQFENNYGTVLNISE